MLLHPCEVLHLLGVAGGVDAEDAGVVVGVVVGGGAVHPVVPVQHPRVQTRVHTCTRLTRYQLMVIRIFEDDTINNGTGSQFYDVHDDD